MLRPLCRRRPVLGSMRSGAHTWSSIHGSGSEYGWASTRPLVLRVATHRHLRVRPGTQLKMRGEDYTLAQSRHQDAGMKLVHSSWTLPRGRRAQKRCGSITCRVETRCRDR